MTLHMKQRLADVRARGGRVIVPQADDALDPVDELLFVATVVVEDEIHAALGF